MAITLNKKMGRPTTRPDDETFIKEYTTMTTKAIAEKYEVKPSTVRAWATRIRRQAAQEAVEPDGR